MNAPLTESVVLSAPWTEPVQVAAGLGDGDGVLILLSDGGPGGRWSHIGAQPDLTRTGPLEDAAPFAALRQEAFGPGTVGLAAYDAGARPATGPRDTVWPDLMLARYPALLTFDHHARTVRAVGRGATTEKARIAARKALAWRDRATLFQTPSPPAETFDAEAPPQVYRDAVADVVARIAAGELFQANVARAWSGVLTPEGRPFDVFLRLQTQRAAPFGAYWRLGDRAIVSNSPELFLAFDARTRRVEARPIKGTRARADDPAKDAALAADLIASAKDRAENLMIVDLMRNDLSRVCTPGSVKVERLFAVESHPTVHHLVSTVTGAATAGVGAADLLEATFPPGSITGAPKHQAMKVIAGHEPPRGPWCGSLFLIEADGGLTASVLIRTAGFQRIGGRWRYRTLAGAGLVADSDPDAERLETEAKIEALRDALVGQQPVQGTVSTVRGRR
ncbi:anthranilate synthase component I family protein [Brevundimonas sp. SORGH_AS_0993]|uniref:anthranilate synthase component I family protein n=1 Tax=Brevundimonas sp. SORGH_AS_0993 TaxID=3041794 RepID=UPI00278012E7|nr:anthranilate synthase component I family protein [Brevundimonas sp. SORGH_AS_0993]MDQ1154534.1 para-aminobenzoate synthetase component 1 [Brevundimonas sp. SORGH_AS_0993]